MLNQPLLEAGALFLSEIDSILKTAQAFENLLDFEYHITVAKKGKTSDFRISFSSDDFHHLAGLHKLADNYALIRDRQSAHELALSGLITDKDLQKSAFYEEEAAESRLWALRNLEALLDSHETVFRFITKLCKGTRIKADWLLEHEIESQPVYVFLGARQGDIPGALSCRSLFPKKSKDYTAGQPRFTLLRKEKRRLSTKETFVLYDRLSISGRS